MEILVTLSLSVIFLGILGVLAWRFRTVLNRNLALLTAGSLAIIFTAGFLWIYYRTPGHDIGPVQPIPFSHNVHSGVKQIQCQYCHPYVAYSNFPGLPPVAKCLHCHN